MTEAILTGKEIKEFTCQDGFTSYALALAVFPWLTEYLLVGHGPGHTGYRDREYKEPGDLS
jgi:hypothetical protein